jgi:hypothetical protein
MTPDDVCNPPDAADGVGSDTETNAGRRIADTPPDQGDPMTVIALTNPAHAARALLGCRGDSVAVVEFDEAATEAGGVLELAESLLDNSDPETAAVAALLCAGDLLMGNADDIAVAVAVDWSAQSEHLSALGEALLGGTAIEDRDTELFQQVSSVLKTMHAASVTGSLPGSIVTPARIRQLSASIAQLL